MNSEYKPNIHAISEQLVLHPDITLAYVCLLDFVYQDDFRGACHATAAMLHVLLAEKGIESKLVSGELGKDGICFNHSWIEIGDRIYDIAVALPLVEKFDSHPVFASHDISSLDSPLWRYGVKSGFSDDPVMQAIKASSFVDFMNNAPYHKNGLWYFVQKLGGRIDLKPSLNKMRKKHANTIWHEKA